MKINIVPGEYRYDKGNTVVIDKKLRVITVRPKKPVGGSKKLRQYCSDCRFYRLGYTGAHLIKKSWVCSQRPKPLKNKRADGEPVYYYVNSQGFICEKFTPVNR